MDSNSDFLGTYAGGASSATDGSNYWRGPTNAPFGGPGPVGPIGGIGPVGVSVGGYTHIHEAEEEEMNRRYVHVLIVDPDERIRVKNALLYAGTTYLTDMTDEELFLALDLGTLLEKHNAVRETILDEEETRKRGKDVYLPPIKIRDLAKRVVVVATF